MGRSSTNSTCYWSGGTWTFRCGAKYLALGFGQPGNQKWLPNTRGFPKNPATKAYRPSINKLSIDFSDSHQISLFAAIFCKDINKLFSSPTSCIVFMDKQLALVSSIHESERQRPPIAKAAHERSERQRPPIPKAAPWLVFPHGKGRKSQSFYNPCEPTNRNCIKSIPEMRGRAYYHKTCHRGWLIVIGGVEDNNDQYSVANSNLDECFLWNPVSLETIQLPKLDRQSFPTESESKEYFMYDLVLSSPPLQSASTFTDNPGHSGECTVFLLFRGIDSRGKVCNYEHILVFCRPGDKQWKIKDLYANARWPGFIESLLCTKGKLYAFCAENWVREIEIEKLWHNVVNDNQTQYIRTFKVEDADFTWIGGGGDKINCESVHWIESCDEIFKVYLNCSLRSYRKVNSTHIFKLDFATMTWVLLNSLEDHVLFLCTNYDLSTFRKCYSTSTACCSAADMGLERGCLFYTLPEDQTLYAFEVEDSATTIIMPCLKLPTPWFVPTWIMISRTENRNVAESRRRITDLLVSKDTAENMSRLDNSGGEIEAAFKHSDFLNDYDSTGAVARFLHPVDYTHFRLACKQNSICLPPLNRISASTRTTTPTYLSPWLISIFKDDEETICNVVDPMNNNDKYLIKVYDRLLVGATIRFSKDGWLLLSIGKNKVVCYNPFTRAVIRLPDVPDGHKLGGMSFSSVPTSRDCEVIAISNWFPLYRTSNIVFMVTKPGKKRASGWTIREFKYEGNFVYDFMPCINNPVFHNGSFYCLDYNGMLGVFRTKGRFRWKVLSKPLKQFSGIYPSFLVVCDKKLLLVNLGQSGKLVEIYKLDDSGMVWVKLKSLGKYALFISYTSSFSVVAPRSCMENKIYFPRLYGERILYYFLDTRSYHCVGNDQHSSQDFHNTKERSNCSWIEPNWSQASLNQELDSMHTI